MGLDRLILLVNDDEDGLFLLVRAASRAFPSASLLQCRNAYQALEVFHRERIDVIVTDNRMPGMDGLTFIRAIRTRDSSVPIIMLTGSDEMHQAALDAGTTLFLSSGS